MALMKKPHAVRTVLGMGVLLLVLWTCAAAPTLLPHLYLIAAVIVLPWRALSFTRKKYVFFLADFCYAANCLVILALIAQPLLLPAAPRPLSPSEKLTFSTAGGAGGRENGATASWARHAERVMQRSLHPWAGRGWGVGDSYRGLFSRSISGVFPWRGGAATVYVVAEGPLAAALLAWRCTWVLGSPEHTISVLIHLLPGMAIAASHHQLPAQVQLPPHLPHQLAAVLDQAWLAPVRTSLAQARVALATLCEHVQPWLNATATQPWKAGLLVGPLHQSLCRGQQATACKGSSSVPGGGQQRQQEEGVQGQRQSGDGAQERLQQEDEQGPGHQQLREQGAGHGAEQGSESNRPLSTPDICQTDAEDGQAWGIPSLVYMLPIRQPNSWVWLVGGPLVFFAMWQLSYYLCVQVVFRSYITMYRFDTSYNAMARRASKGRGGTLAAWVRQGSVTRRICAYGLIQLGFTCIAMVVGILTYYSPLASLAWQCVKLGFPLWWGWKDTKRLSSQVQLAPLHPQLDSTASAAQGTS